MSAQASASNKEELLTQSRTGSRTAADRKQEVVRQRKPVQDKLDETEVVTGVKSGGQTEPDRRG